MGNQFEAELLTDKKIVTEEDAREGMNLLHSKGPSTVILSSTELGSDEYLLGMASTVVNGVKTVVKVNIPKFPASFVGTGDLFTALVTAWLTKTEGDLKLSMERTIDTMQAVLGRTLNQANAEAKVQGLLKPSPAMMELKLIQSKKEIEAPPSSIEASLLE